MIEFMLVASFLLYAISTLFIFISEKVFYIYCLVLSLPLMFLWGQHYYSTMQPGYSDGAGGALGYVFAGAFTMCFVFSTGLSYVTKLLFK
jgi:hypothetical protein